MNINYYNLLFGEDINISKYITLHIPTIREIVFEYGEENYFNLAYKLTATSYQLMLFFYENDIDYTQISDYEVFLLLCGELKPNETYIFFGDLDFSSLQLAQSNSTKHKVLLNNDNEVVIDEAIYYQIVEYIRTMNNIKREYKIPGNEATRKIYIREAKMDLEKRKRMKKDTSPILLSTISSLCNYPGFKYDYNSIDKLTIYALFDASKRIHAYEDYRSLINGLYGGTLDSKSIDKKRLIWDRDLDKK